MRLSEQIRRDFLSDVYPETKKTRTYEMSYDYLVDLIAKVQELEQTRDHDEQALHEIEEVLHRIGHHGG